MERINKNLLNEKWNDVSITNTKDLLSIRGGLLLADGVTKTKGATYRTGSPHGEFDDSSQDGCCEDM